MSDSLDTVRRDTLQALRILEEAAGRAMSLWRDDVAKSFQSEFVGPLQQAAADYERALRSAIEAADEVERLGDG